MNPMPCGDNLCESCSTAATSFTCRGLLIIFSMAVYKQKGSKNWWYKFTWNGQLVRESTKQTNKRVAEQIEAARRTQFAKGEVGIQEKSPVPTLQEFAEQKFLPFIRAEKAAKPRTVAFYETCTANLSGHSELRSLQLDRIKAEHITGFVESRRSAGMQTSTINRDLATLRRMLNLAGHGCDHNRSASLGQVPKRQRISRLLGH